MKPNLLALISATGLLVLQMFLASEKARAADPTPADLVDALNGVFGKPQARGAHTPRDFA